MKICKECNKGYKKEKYFQHRHGKNNPNYINGIKNKVEYKICKECNEEYRLSRYQGGEGNRHNHGKNSSFYGKCHSKKAKKIMSVVKSGKNHPFYGKVFSEEHRKRMSQSMKKRWKNGDFDNIALNSKSGYRKDIGHFVRSTWEANFVRVLQYSKIDYEYELVRFDTSTGMYTPDFYLPEKDIYVEIKGWEVYGQDKQKSKRIECRKRYGIRILMLRKDQYDLMKNKYKKLILNWE